MSAKHHLSDYDCGRAVGRQGDDESVTSVAVAMVVSKSVISASLCSPRGKKEQKFHSWPDSCKRCNCYRSARSTSRRLNEVRLYARKPVRCIPLQPRHRRERLRWCKEHAGWDHQNCSLVMFSDESHFRVTSDSGHQLRQRERGTRYAQKFVWEHDRYGRGVMVWAGILRSSRERENITSHL
ncbi:HTH_Tnp_Tc3_2 domain-containing protein [Trichonephila clavipes]|nr:HTH_Tnp_Tc3_2 domain-containing protein [Trichonephila clavipes]